MWRAKGYILHHISHWLIAARILPTELQDYRVILLASHRMKAISLTDFLRFEDKWNKCLSLFLTRPEHWSEIYYRSPVGVVTQQIQ